MVMFTMSLKDSFLLASRISMPTMCLFSSRSRVMPSSTSILSSTYTSLSWMYRASASLSYSIFKWNHLHLLFFFTALITKNLSLSSLYVTLKNLSELFIHAFNLFSTDGSRNSGTFRADSTSISVILCHLILFFACLVYLMGFTEPILTNIHLIGNQKNKRCKIQNA